MRAARYIAATGSAVIAVWCGLVFVLGPRLGVHASLLLVPLFLLAPHLVRGTIDTLLQTRIRTPTLLERASRGGVPAQSRTLVVVPVLLASEDDVRAALRTLEDNYLANRGPFVHFALLTDFADAGEERVDDDERLASLLRSGLDAMREKHRVDAHVLMELYRKRRWNARERRYMGWERKRGKLVHLNRAITGHPDHDFVLGNYQRALLESIRFVATLDVDAILDPGGLVHLVAILEHPSNQWAGIVQPRVVRKHRPSQSLWSYLQFGPFRPISRVIRNMNMEVFGTTRYFGKGLYDPRSFERSGASDVPDDTLLSHDLVEGAHAGVIAASDVTLREDVPGTLVSYVARLHRWTRGDVQALPWCLPWVRRSNGELARNTLSLLNRYWISWLALDALFIPTCTVGVVSAWWVRASSARLVYAAVVTVLLWPAFFRVVVRCVQALFGRIALRGLGRLLMMQSQAALTSAMLVLALMPCMAVVLVDAIVRSCVRMLITRRHLLEWRTAAQGEHQSREGRAWLSGALAGGAAVAMASAALALLATGPRPDILAIAALWAVSPVTAYMLQKIQVPSRMLASPAPHGVARVLPLPEAPAACDVVSDPAKAIRLTEKPEPPAPTARRFQDATPDDVLVQMCAAYGIQPTSNKDEMRQQLRAAMMPDDAQPSASSVGSTKT